MKHSLFLLGALAFWQISFADHYMVVVDGTTQKTIEVAANESAVLRIVGLTPDSNYTCYSPNLLWTVDDQCPMARIAKVTDSPNNQFRFHTNNHALGHEQVVLRLVNTYPNVIREQVRCSAQSPQQRREREVISTVEKVHHDIEHKPFSDLQRQLASVADEIDACVNVETIQHYQDLRALLSQPRLAAEFQRILGFIHELEAINLEHHIDAVRLQGQITLKRQTTRQCIQTDNPYLQALYQRFDRLLDALELQIKQATGQVDLHAQAATSEFEAYLEAFVAQARYELGQNKSSAPDSASNPQARLDHLAMAINKLSLEIVKANEELSRIQNVAFAQKIRAQIDGLLEDFQSLDQECMGLAERLGHHSGASSASASQSSDTNLVKQAITQGEDLIGFAASKRAELVNASDIESLNTLNGIMGDIAFQMLKVEEAQRHFSGVGTETKLRLNQTHNELKAYYGMYKNAIEMFQRKQQSASAQSDSLDDDNGEASAAASSLPHHEPPASPAPASATVQDADVAPTEDTADDIIANLEQLLKINDKSDEHRTRLSRATEALQRLDKTSLSAEQKKKVTQLGLAAIRTIRLLKF